MHPRAVASAGRFVGRNGWLYMMTHILYENTVLMALVLNG